jgi:hypothetical protein
MPVNATARKFLTDLVKAVDNFAEDTAVRFNFETVGVEGSGDVDNIGIPLLWDETAAAFLELAAPADWTASVVTAVGDVVKPTTRDGNEYVCTVAGTTNDTEGEPTWVTTLGGETIETDLVQWTARKAYAVDSAGTSPLKNKSRIAVTVGDLFGVGFNKKDTTLSGTPVNMTVIYRGEAALINEGFIWGSVAAADQAEFLLALEDARITTITNAEVVSPTFTS